ncbi:MAG TPA: hypothetical protein VNV42_06800 [Solirubrobacteraceae bacterium]|nr:hypothetical protein [Solirubrobacteraceae bacterium]
MEHDGHSEQRRFPVSEGYDRAAVDAYLRDLAAEVDTLRRVSGDLHQRVQVLGGELRALTASLRGEVGEVPAASVPQPPATPVVALVEPSPPVAQPEPSPVAQPELLPAAVPPEPLPVATSSGQAERPVPVGARGEQDLDGARLVALNMALEGQPRERADAYLAERFQLDDRTQLLDEVYAAVEG